MIVDMRVYTFHPGRMPDWVKAYEELAWPLQKQYLGKCVGWYTSIEGKLHQVVHLWEFESQADREARRGAMMKDPGWPVFQARVKELGALISQENTILSPAAFALMK